MQGKWKTVKKKPSGESLEAVLTRGFSSFLYNWLYNKRCLHAVWIFIIVRNVSCLNLHVASIYLQFIVGYQRRALHVFKTDGGARFHSIIITVGNDDYVSKFPDILWKTESVCKLLTVGFLHEYLSKQKSILLKNLTRKKAATTWTETPLSCECALGVKNSAGF